MWVDDHKGFLHISVYCSIYATSVLGYDAASLEEFTFGI